MDIWEKIKAHAGETFYTVTGKYLTYEIDGDYLKHNRSKVAIPRSCFEKAVELQPSQSNDMTDDVIGPAYVFAILKDPRIGGIK